MIPTAGSSPHDGMFILVLEGISARSPAAKKVDADAGGVACVN